MSSIQHKFIEFCIESNVLRFGEFKTKAGRLSPYFFNAGLFNTGAMLSKLADFYARTLIKAMEDGRIECDMIFGPAYKGITLAAAVAMRMAELGYDLPFAYNRKEEFDREGRYVEVRFNNLIVVSIYFPSGSSSEERQQAKFRFLDVIKGRLDELIRDGRDVVLCGDFNIAHKEIDIKNWKGNLKNSGFLPEERQWITDRLKEGWQDVFRRLDPRPDRFTWWSNRGRARINNVGWRIDYQFSTPAIASTAKETDIYRDERFSDHAPLTVVYDFDLK